MPAVVQLDHGELDLIGADAADLGFLNVHVEWLATTIDKIVFIAPRQYRVKKIVARVEVSGTDTTTGVVTLAVKKVASGTAIASGTALHSGTVNLKGTAATNQVLTLSTTSSVLDIATGDAIGIDLTGTMTAATGALTISLAPK